MDIRLLDCTLRDGGFLNDWNFGRNTMLTIFNRLNNANMDIIEIGFLDGRSSKNLERSMNPTTLDFDECFVSINHKKSMVVAMIDYGTCDINNIYPSDFIDGIRVIFKKKDIDNALAFCKQIKDKGYKVFVQPVSITTYSDKEMIELVEKVNVLKPYAMSMVDTYGLMHKENLIKYFYIMDNNLDPEIIIGYHSHNNFQLAYSNSIELANLKTRRPLIIDASIYGMGKSAGNTNTELVAMYFNENFDKNYDIREILEIIDCEIIKLRHKYTWGYSLPFYISALNDCHPKYVDFLRKKNTLSIKSIDEILSKIEHSKKLTFDKSYIEQLYYEYQNNVIDDTKAYQSLSKEISGREILLLGPGKSVVKEKEKIQDFINNNNPVVFSVNYMSNIFKTDYVFISNSKRYGQYSNTFAQGCKNFKLIATSNITEIEKEMDYKLNYSHLICPNDLIGDTSMYMLVKALEKMSVKKITLAGFDGFRKFLGNYCDDSLELSPNDDKAQFTKAVIEELENFRKTIEIDFLTKSTYSKHVKPKKYATL